MESVTNIEDHVYFEYNELQEKLLEEFIDKGGRMTTYQRGRGRGYSTFAIAQAIQQATTNPDRKVIYVYDDKGWTPQAFRDVAHYFFNRSAVWIRDRSVIKLAQTEIHLVRPDRRGDSLRGRRIDDVFGDFDGNSIDKNEEFFQVLNACRNRAATDGTGLQLFIIR